MKKFMRAGLGALVLVVAVSAHAWQMTPQPFSSDMAITTKTGEKVTGKFYFSPPKQRMDMSTQGRDVIMITDAKTQTSDILMVQQHMYIETHGGQASPMAANMPKIDTNLDPSNPCAARADATCKKVGSETMNGRMCDKWEFTDNKKGTTNAWIDQKLHFPIKAQNSDGSVFELSNVKDGAPAASVFEIPADYRKMDMGMMGGRPQ
jgi:outer membrane lipoprotein-sorting protein